jgi:(1->4)-alpha-D-glucan 1-alpha-D-glucosylmutase
LQHPPGITPEAIAEHETLAGRFQQVTSPVMAKGVEDTSFYVWVPLASVNEVGGDPRRPTTTPRQFHEQNQLRSARFRQSMLASTTHDTKRSEDVRARLNVLSEIPSDWRNVVQRFSRLNRRFRHDVEGSPAPSPNDEYLYYQSLLGIWPLAPPTAEDRGVLVERLQGYMEKATHEAKQRTSWINPNPAYDQAVRDFVVQTLGDSPQNRFITEFQAFHERIVDAGQYNALAQLVLKLLAPGVPDIYQGQELWDYSLVDPDNRRPVNYDQRREGLGQVGQTLVSAIDAPADKNVCSMSLRDPKLKLFVTRTLLDLRRRLAHLWQQGDYVPLDVTGPLADHVIAFGWRGAESQRIELLAVVPRFVQKLIDAQSAAGIPGCHASLPPAVWQDTALAWPMVGHLTGSNVFTGSEHTLEEATLPLGALLAAFPLAVLETAP